MSNNEENQISTSGVYKPSVSFTVLRACKECGGVHPLAREPKLPGDKCPDCGTPTLLGETVTLTEDQVSLNPDYLGKGILEKMIGEIKKTLNKAKGD